MVDDIDAKTDGAVTRAHVRGMSARLPLRAVEPSGVPSQPLVPGRP